MEAVGNRGCRQSPRNIRDSQVALMMGTAPASYNLEGSPGGGACLKVGVSQN